jgi:hypothetical protein
MSKVKSSTMILLISLAILCCSILIERPIKSSEVCGVLVCHNGKATYAISRGLPLPVWHGPSIATQPGDINDNTTPEVLWINSGIDYVFWLIVVLIFRKLYSNYMK